MKKFLLLLFLVGFVTAEVSISDFFPFGTANGDTELIRGSDVSSPPQNLSLPFPFFGLPQTTLWVNENGLISFTRKISDFTPWCKAAQSDYRIIAPFWADVDARRSGDIFYRQTTDAAILTKGEAELAKAFNDIGHINLKWAFIATWVNVTYFRDPPGSDESSRLRNTFQAILLSDGSQSFTIFYYNQITWTTGDVSNGVNGLGGTPAEVGYDLGDQTHYEFVTGSCSNAVINITKSSNAKSPGKWIFKTFALPTTPPPECQTKYTGDFCVTPSTIDTLGHINLDISQIQLTVTETVTCRYRDPYANVTEYDATLLSLTQIQCFTPYFYTVGRITMELVIHDKDGSERTLSGYLYIRAMTEADNSLMFEPQANGSLLFKWNPSDLNYGDDSKSLKSIFHLIYMKTCEVAVEAGEACIENPILCAICVTQPEACVEVYAEKVIVHAVASAVIEKGEEMIPIPLPGPGGPLSEICGSEITPEKMACSGAWSLGEFIGDSLESKHRPLYNGGKELAAWVGDNCPNAKKMCKAWIHAFGDHDDEKLAAATTSTPPHFHLPIPTDVPPCPPTLDMAEVDPNFVVDPQCHGASSCFYHPGAEICYFSAVPSPSGGGQQCCYQNRQIYLQRPGAGYPTILHPSIQAGFPHKAFEEIPLTVCCMVADKEDCDKYMKARNPDDGSNYTAPTTSLGNGDPHYTTFDGLYYTFNGAGEFWLVKNSDKQPFSAQARHVVLSKDADYAYLMAYAFQPYPNASIIQVEANPMSTEIYHNRVPIPKEILQKTYTTTDVSISMQSGGSDEMIFVTFNAGFSFKIQFFDNMWGAITCFIDNRLKGNLTHGLLGSFDGNSLNDLETPEGVIVPANSTTEIIHYKFGLEWYVAEEDSLFDYFSKNYSDYYFPNFVPRFDYGSGQLPPDALAICDNDASCLWDLISTGDASVANQTRDNSQDYNNTVTVTSQNVTMCPALADPINGRCNVANYLPNTKATFQCNPGYELDGNQFLVCGKNGNWNGTEPICVPVITTTTEEALTSTSELYVSSTIASPTTTSSATTTSLTATTPTTTTSTSSKATSFTHLLGLLVFLKFYLAVI